MVTLHSRTLFAGGLRTHLLQGGAGEPVLLIHGWPETSHEWRGVGARLAERLRVVAPDTRGHGRTEAPASGYTRAELARDQVNLLDALGIARAHVVAHDWGGIIAVKLALDHPERVARLALLDTICTGWPRFVTYYYWMMVPGRAERFFAERGADFIASIIGGGSEPPLPLPPECPLEFASPGLTAPRAWATPADLREYAAPFERASEIAATLAYYRSMQFHRVVADASAPHGERFEPVSHEEMARAWEAGRAGGEYLDYAIEDRHKQFGGPTLWLYGKYLLEATGAKLDARGFPTGDPSFESFPRHFPRLRAHGVGGGHFFPEEDPAGTAALLLEFLSARD